MTFTFSSFLEGAGFEQRVVGLSECWPVACGQVHHHMLASLGHREALFGLSKGISSSEMMQSEPSGLGLLLVGSPHWAFGTHSSLELFPSGEFFFIFFKPKDRHSSWISSGRFHSLTGSE